MIFHTNCVLCAMPRMAHGGKWAKLLRVFPTGADLRLQEKNREREKSTVLVWGPSPSMGPQPVGIPLSAQGWPCGVCSQPACVHGRPGLLLRRGCLTWAEQTGRWVHLGAAAGGPPASCTHSHSPCRVILKGISVKIHLLTGRAGGLSCADSRTKWSQWLGLEQAECRSVGGLDTRPPAAFPGGFMRSSIGGRAASVVGTGLVSGAWTP